MKIPMDLSATVLRYKLDPGEPGVLRSATAGRSMPAVTNQELGNLRQFSREAAARGDQVVLAKIEYKTALVDGKLSIKAGRTTVYSVPSQQAAEARYTRDIGACEPASESSLESAKGVLGSQGDSNVNGKASSSRTDSGSPESEVLRQTRENNAPSGRNRSPSSSSDSIPDSLKIQRERLENERVRIEGSLENERERLEKARAAREEGARPAESIRGIEKRETRLNDDLKDLNREIARLEAAKVFDRDARLNDVARENASAQVSALSSVAAISNAAGAFTAVM